MSRKRQKTLGPNQINMSYNEDRNIQQYQNYIP
jgi:hypothetical protein